MSVRPAIELLCSSASAVPVIANVIAARARDLGGVAVRRVLPAAARRMVGPFTFLDERDWKEGRFPKVPGDNVEFVPLPD